MGARAEFSVRSGATVRDHPEGASADAGMTSITRSTTSCGGDDRTRTDDPLLAKQVLYQLSYVPAPLEEHWKRGEGLHLALVSRGYRVYRGLGRARTIWTLLARLGSASGDTVVVS